MEKINESKKLSTDNYMNSQSPSGKKLLKDKAYGNDVVERYKDNLNEDNLMKNFPWGGF